MIVGKGEEKTTKPKQLQKNVHHLPKGQHIKPPKEPKVVGREKSNEKSFFGRFRTCRQREDKCPKKRQERGDGAREAS